MSNIKHHTIAGAAVKVRGKVDSILDGIKFAEKSIESGVELGILENLMDFTNEIK